MRIIEKAEQVEQIYFKKKKWDGSEKLDVIGPGQFRSFLYAGIEPAGMLLDHVFLRNAVVTESFNGKLLRPFWSHIVVQRIMSVICGSTDGNRSSLTGPALTVSIRVGSIVSWLGIQRAWVFGD